MPFTMHSHSGQFCPGHAKDSLEEVVQRAIALELRVFAMTEHMPRDQEKDLYPEEVQAGETLALLASRHEAYLQEAHRLQVKYRPQITILIGFEAEWIRPSNAALVASLAASPLIDFFVGSVHHVHEIPIDFGRELYRSARDVSGGTDERLFADYFDAQYEMIRTLRPRVVGHFDLVRLLSDEPDVDLMGLTMMSERIMRNLRLVREQGGLLEINSSALRKGMREPYPGRSICESFLSLGGRFTLSDDSHGIAHVGLNFKRAIEYVQSLGVTELHYLEKQQGNSQNREGSSLQWKAMGLSGLKLDQFPSTLHK